MRSGLTGSRSATLRRLALLKRWCRAAVTGRMRPCRPEAPIRVVSLDMNVGYGRQPVAAAGHPPPLRRSLVGDGQYSDRRTGVFMGNGVGPPVRSGGQFVGRQAESALVGLTIDQASIGAPTALVVRGEPGIGKTRLLAEAVARATAKGHHVLWVRSNALEGRVPFGALSVALDQAAECDPVFKAGAAAVRAFIGGAAGAEESTRLSFAQICDTFTRTLVEA